METTQITKEKLAKFVLCAKHYVTANIAKKSMLWIACDALLDLATKKLKKVEREKDMWRMKLCKKTSTKHIDFNKQGQYQFTEEDNLKVLSEFDRIDAEEIAFPCMITKKGDYPEKGLTYDVRDAFKGIVIAVDEYGVHVGVQEDGTPILKINAADSVALKKMLDDENARIEQEEDEPVEQE